MGIGFNSKINLRLRSRTYAFRRGRVDEDRSDLSRQIADGLTQPLFRPAIDIAATSWFPADKGRSHSDSFDLASFRQNRAQAAILNVNRCGIGHVWATLHEDADLALHAR
jgi:hypothetical protein